MKTGPFFLGGWVRRIDKLEGYARGKERGISARSSVRGLGRSGSLKTLSA